MDASTPAISITEKLNILEQEVKQLLQCTDKAAKKIVKVMDLYISPDFSESDDAELTKEYLCVAKLAHIKLN
jgi:hypothetical protein